jgi:hypothetical protein
MEQIHSAVDQQVFTDLSKRYTTKAVGLSSVATVNFDHLFPSPFAPSHHQTRATGTSVSARPTLANDDHSPSSQTALVITSSREDKKAPSSLSSHHNNNSSSSSSGNVNGATSPAATGSSSPSPHLVVGWHRSKSSLSSNAVLHSEPSASGNLGLLTGSPIADRTKATDH